MTEIKNSVFNNHAKVSNKHDVEIVMQINEVMLAYLSTMQKLGTTNVNAPLILIEGNND